MLTSQSYVKISNQGRRFLGTSSSIRQPYLSTTFFRRSSNQVITETESTVDRQPAFSATSSPSSSDSNSEAKSLNKKGIAEEIASTHELSVAKSQRILDTVLDTIMEAVGDNRPVRLKNFGRFDCYTSKERMGVKPGTQEKITIPPKKRIRFKASSTFTKSAKE